MERMSKPKFIKEIEKSEGKERAKCGRWYIRVYGELDNKPMVELESLEIIVKELHKLEEENKNLKEEIENHKQNIMQDELEIIPKLEEENKKLNIKVASLEGEIKGLIYTIEKLKEENQYREDIADVLPEGEGHIAEETIQDLQKRIDELVWFEKEYHRSRDRIKKLEWILEHEYGRKVPY